MKKEEDSILKDVIGIIGAFLTAYGFFLVCVLILPPLPLLLLARPAHPLAVGLAPPHPIPSTYCHPAAAKTMTALPSTWKKPSTTISCSTAAIHSTGIPAATTWTTHSDSAAMMAMVGRIGKGV